MNYKRQLAKMVTLAEKHSEVLALTCIAACLAAVAANNAAVAVLTAFLALGFVTLVEDHNE